MPARIAAVTGLSTAAVMAVVGLVAGPAAAQPGTFGACVDEAVARITVEAAARPASERAAYIRTEVAAARARCGALLTSTSPTTRPTPTPTTPTPLPGSTYDVPDSEPVVSGQQGTLEANCRAGDRLVNYTYQVPTPTGSDTSRTVNVSSNGTGARVTFRVVGPVANNTATLTVVCRVAT